MQDRLLRSRTDYMNEIATLTMGSTKMMPFDSNKAAIQNPALKRLSRIVGDWQTIGKHPYFPDRTLHGRTTFAWAEGGAFLSMHTHMGAPGLPDGIAIFGSDDMLNGSTSTSVASPASMTSSS